MRSSISVLAGVFAAIATADPLQCATPYSAAVTLDYEEISVPSISGTPLPNPYHGILFSSPAQVLTTLYFPASSEKSKGIGTPPNFLSIPSGAVTISSSTGHFSLLPESNIDIKALKFGDKVFVEAWSEAGLKYAFDCGITGGPSGPYSCSTWIPPTGHQGFSNITELRISAVEQGGRPTEFLLGDLGFLVLDCVPLVVPSCPAAAAQSVILDFDDTSPKTLAAPYHGYQWTRLKSNVFPNILAASSAAAGSQLAKSVVSPPNTLEAYDALNIRVSAQPSANAPRVYCPFKLKSLIVTPAEYGLPSGPGGVEFTVTGYGVAGKQVWEFKRLFPYAANETKVKIELGGYAEVGKVKAVMQRQEVAGFYYNRAVLFYLDDVVLEGAT